MNVLVGNLFVHSMFIKFYVLMSIFKLSCKGRQDQMTDGNFNMVTVRIVGYVENAWCILMIGTRTYQLYPCIY